MMAIIRDQSDIEAGLAGLLRLDPALSRIAERVGALPLRLSASGFAGMASIVVSQMVSRASADAIWSRIAAAEALTEAAYLRLDPEVVAGFGLSRAKAKTLQGLAEMIATGRFDPHGVCSLEPEAAMAAITALPGIGPWTAEVYLMFCGGHPDIFPAGDVALQAAVAHGLSLPVRPDGRSLRDISAKWQPFRSIAARLFWAYYAAEVKREVAPRA